MRGGGVQNRSADSTILDDQLIHSDDSAAVGACLVLLAFAAFCCYHLLQRKCETAMTPAAPSSPTSSPPEPPDQPSRNSTEVPRFDDRL